MGYGKHESPPAEKDVPRAEYEDLSEDEDDSEAAAPPQILGSDTEPDFEVDGSCPQKFVGFVSKRTIERYTEMDLHDMLRSQETFCEMSKTLLTIGNKVKGVYQKLLDNFVKFGKDEKKEHCKQCFHCFEVMPWKYIKPQGRPMQDSNKQIELKLKLDKKNEKSTSVKRLQRQPLAV